MNKIVIFFLLVIVFSTSIKINAQTESGEKYYHLKGKIGNINAISMDLFAKNGKIFGKYYYDNIGVSILLNGTLNDDNTFELSESVNESYGSIEIGVLSGKFNKDNSISGTWSNKDKTKEFQFELKENYLHSVRISFYEYSNEFHLQDNDTLSSININLNYALPTTTPIETSYTSLFDNYRDEVFCDSDCGNIDECINKLVVELVDAYNESSSDFEGEELQSYFFSWDILSNNSVVYNDKDFLTLKQNNYEYTGGAHGISNISYSIFDLRSGEKWDIDSIIIKNNKLLELIKIKIIEDGFEEWVFDMDEVFISDNIGIDGSNVYFLYNVYEITPYVCGDIEVTFSYNEIYNFLTPEFKDRMGIEE